MTKPDDIGSVRTEPIEVIYAEEPELGSVWLTSRLISGNVYLYGGETISVDLEGCTINLPGLDAEKDEDE